MAQDITWIEDTEETLIGKFLKSSGIGLVALAIVLLVSAGVSPIVLAVILFVMHIGMFALMTIRFGKRKGRLADRVTKVEQDQQVLMELGAPA